jgi:hypothetical protein
MSSIIHGASDGLMHSARASTIGRFCKFALLGNLYLHAIFSVLAVVVDRSIVNVFAPIWFAVGAVPILLGFIFHISKTGNTKRARQLSSVVGGTSIVVVGAMLLGVADVQSVYHVLLGATRLGFIPVAFVVFALYVGSRDWLFSSYVRHARLAYSSTFVLMLYALTADKLLPLAVGHGVDPVLLVSALTRGRDKHRLYDLGLVVVVGGLSLKRGAWLSILVVIGVQGVYLLYRFFEQRGSQASSRGLISGVAAVLLLGLVAVAGSHIGPISARMDTTAASLAGAPDQAVSERMEENRLAQSMIGSGGTSELILGHGAGYRFEKSARLTGALHNSLYTGLALGGILWAALIFWIAIVFAQSRPPWRFALTAALLATLALKGNMLLDPLLPAILGCGVMQGRASRRA